MGEELEGVRGWLVDDADDDLPRISQLAEERADLGGGGRRAGMGGLEWVGGWRGTDTPCVTPRGKEKGNDENAEPPRPSKPRPPFLTDTHRFRHERIQARGGLIEEENRRVRQKLRRHGHTFPFAPRDAPDEGGGAADQGVRAALQAHVQEDALHPLSLDMGLDGLGHPDHGVETEMLPHGQGGEEQIILVDVGCQTEKGVVRRLPVHENVPFKFLVAERDAVEEGGFPRA